MKLLGHKLPLFTCLCMLLFNLQAKKTDLAKNKLNRQQLSFKENLGQVSDQNYKTRPDVLFSGSTGNLSFHLKKDGISYQLSRVDSWKEEQDLKTQDTRKYADQYTIYRIDMNWLNANSAPIIKKTGELEAYDNYYLSTCPNGALNVKSYNQITYQQIYDGIDVTWYEKNGNLKYDYAVAPGADYRQIQFEIKGATKISINAQGELEIVSPLGTIVEESPLVFQNKKTLPARWKINDNKLSFEIDNINPDLPFIIDPAVRVWGTYFGLSSISYDCINLKNDDLCMVGYTGSNLVTIATTGAYQNTFGGFTDAFVARFNTLGTLLWCTYYGGSSSEYGKSCAQDSSGNIYLLGTTRSYTDAVIASAGAHQATFGNPGSNLNDLFLVKFNSAGIRQWGTYYGGNNEEDAGTCCTDRNGNVFICGTTRSFNSNIASSGSHQPNFGGGTSTEDGFLVKFNSSGLRQWGTYYGGVDYDAIKACLTDSSGNVFISGSTNTSANNVIATSGSYQPSLASSAFDSFLAKFNSSGVRQWGTYYGGTNDDLNFASSTDQFGNIYLCGESRSQTGIATPGAFQGSLLSANDTYLAKFSSNGMLLWGTYYAGFGTTHFCETDKAGDIFFGGASASFSNVATIGSHQTIHGGGIQDGFVAKFNTSGIRQWGTYYGGLDQDYIFGCSIDGKGAVYICGYTKSTNDTAISTAGSYQSSFLSGDLFINSFLAKLKDTETQIIVNNTENSLLGQFLKLYPNPTGNTITLLIDDTFSGTRIFKLEIINCLGQVCKEIVTNTEDFQINIHLSELPDGIYTLTAKGDHSIITSKKFIISR